MGVKTRVEVEVARRVNRLFTAAKEGRGRPSDSLSQRLRTAFLGVAPREWRAAVVVPELQPIFYDKARELGITAKVRVRIDRFEKGNQWYFHDAYYDQTASHSGLAMISLDVESYAKLHEQKDFEGLRMLARHELGHHLDVGFLQQYCDKICDFSSISHDAFLLAVLIHARAEGFAEARPLLPRNLTPTLEQHTETVQQAFGFLKKHPQPYNLYTGAVAKGFAAFRDPQVQSPKDLPPFDWYEQGRVILEAVLPCESNYDFFCFLKRIGSLTLKEFYAEYFAAVKRITGNHSKSIYKKEDVERVLQTL